MRNNFWKWLKRFFIILPIVMMLLQIVFSMGSYWRDNGNSNFIIGDDDFIQAFVNNGSWQSNGITNPLLLEPTAFGGIVGRIQDTFITVYSRFIGMSTTANPPEVFYDDPVVYTYPLIICNFLTWWIVVELLFLFFRFITFLISWVNSLFDNTFKKINK